MSDDPITDNMREDTGHECIACPLIIRDLTATVHNALAQWDANRLSLPDFAMMESRMEGMRFALSLFEPFVEEHLNAIKEWKRGRDNYRPE
jgi:hypothetical protein